MVSSKKGISSRRLHRVLGITYKSSWFLIHRIRECMRDGFLAPFGSNGGAVGVDETFIGKEPGVKKAREITGSLLSGNQQPRPSVSNRLICDVEAA